MCIWVPKIHRKEKYMNIYIHRLAHYYADKYGFDTDTVEQDMQRLRLAIATCIREYKQLCDHYTHDLRLPPLSKPAENCNAILRKYLDVCGTNSMMVQTLIKMAVSVELPKKVVQEEYRKSSEVPPAFNPQLIAHCDIKYNKVEKFVIDSIMQDDINLKPTNYRRVMRQARRHYKQYMKHLKHKIYKLCNGSATRIEDIYNIRDINGIVYLPDDYNVREEFRRLIQHFKILNFDTDMEFIEYSCNGALGKHEVNPDDSGKSRELYCLDPCVQIISKAVHECLDYIAKRMAGNGTYDQHRFIRKCIKEKWHQNSYIISTDMSKYSDTLLRKYILMILNDIGFPLELNMEMDKLYSLPVIDSLRNVIWSGTLATYQGQYGDFPMITIVNLLAQCLIYDYTNTEMVYPTVEEMKRGNYDNIGNSAVGDDTIMRFEKFDPEIRNIVKAVYNTLGVNINLTKTHELIYGRGFVDFLKRVITSEGLIPYVRYEAFREGNFDEICNELFRLYRDGMPYREWSEFVKYILPSQYEWILRLHYINGGVYRGTIEYSDLVLFQERNKSLLKTYKLKEDDELRKWLKAFREGLKEEELDLCDTALVGYYPEYNLLFDETDEDIDDFKLSTKEEISEIIIANILNMTYTGYEYSILDCPSRLIGLKWSDVENDESLSEVVDFFEDYNAAAAYRYMTVNNNKYRETVFFDMISLRLSDITLDDSIIRIPKVEVKNIEEYVEIVNKGRASMICNVLSRFAHLCGWSIEYEYSWEVDKYFACRNGIEVRLYSLIRPNSRSRRIFTLAEFKEIIRCWNGRLSDDDVNVLYDMYYDYM